VSSAGTAVAVSTLLAAMISVFLRWRGSRGTEHQQLTWLVFVYTGAIIALALLCGVPSAYLSSVSYPTVFILTVGVAGMTLGVPVAVGIAILGHHLYDIDRIIKTGSSTAPSSTAL
jgi:hypothetical protein